MTKKYTPGPWFAGERFKVEHDQPYFACGIGNGAFHVGYAYAGMIPHDEAVANARLMALAPEMFEACKFVLDQIYDPTKPMVQGRLYSDALAPDSDEKSVRTWLIELIAKVTNQAGPGEKETAAPGPPILAAFFVLTLLLSKLTPRKLNLWELFAGISRTASQMISESLIAFL